MPTPPSGSHRKSTSNPEPDETGDDPEPEIEEEIDHWRWILEPLQEADNRKGE